MVQVHFVFKDLQLRAPVFTNADDAALSVDAMTVVSGSERPISQYDVQYPAPTDPQPKKSLASLLKLSSILPPPPIRPVVVAAAPTPAVCAGGLGTFVNGTPLPAIPGGISCVAPLRCSLGCGGGVAVAGKGQVVVRVEQPARMFSVPVSGTPVALESTGREVLAACGRSVVVIPLASPVPYSLPSPSRVTSLAVSDRFLAAGTAKGTVELYLTPDRRRVSLGPFPSAVRAVSASPDGSMLAICCERSPVVFIVHTSKRRKTLSLSLAPVKVPGGFDHASGLTGEARYIGGWVQDLVWGEGGIDVATAYAAPRKEGGESVYVRDCCVCRLRVVQAQDGPRVLMTGTVHPSPSVLKWGARGGPTQGASTTSTPPSPSLSLRDGRLYVAWTPEWVTVH
ncbi:hypothetical protein KIPB_010990 [Kipferlia bialata]|uniref:Uncharacterized protein n=1 Tax=Kipferlia bialata TaxID=797122 RepID=A0A9K3D4X0_9EUKA|nr:hypothetical protein KIPB_010990 [Kipferlia bialata]|eukprot:g10990.t1